MKGVKYLMIALIIHFADKAEAQLQKMVSLEMYGYNKRYPSLSGSGVSTFASVPFVVKTTDEEGTVTQNVYEPTDWRNPIETFACLKKEIDLWLSQGYKLFSFNVTATGESSSSFRYLVLLVKEE